MVAGLQRVDLGHPRSSSHAELAPAVVELPRVGLPATGQRREGRGEGVGRWRRGGRGAALWGRRWEEGRGEEELSGRRRSERDEKNLREMSEREEEKN